MSTVKDLVAALKNLVEEAEAEATKFEDKGNKSSGGRLRKKMQETKKMAQEIRVSVMEKLKAPKEA